MNRQDDIIEIITDFYLNSGDFNGLPVRSILSDFEIDESELKNILASLIRNDKISLNFGDIHPNPHVKAFAEEPSEKQIEKLRSSDLKHTCAYPSCSHLKEVVDPLNYQGRPFTLRLGLGEAQLSYESFDLSVLEFYRNDPRYDYSNTDIHGCIIGDDNEGMTELSASDQIYLKTFGFSYDSDLNRAVASFLIYLSRLSPEHQQMWNAKIVKGDYSLHPDYYRTAILGRLQEGISVFTAFIWELHCINEICALIRRPQLFREDLSEKERPRSFGFLIRPTLKEYHDFIHTLDKLIAENINRRFFLNDISFEYDEVRKDGKVVVRQKGTIQILDEWLEKMFRVQNRQPIEEMLDTFREIRRLRQRPAHAIDDDIFDQKYFKQQREVIMKAYEAIRVLRLILKRFPGALRYEIPDYLESGEIWTI